MDNATEAEPTRDPAFMATDALRKQLFWSVDRSLDPDLGVLPPVSQAGIGLWALVRRTLELGAIYRRDDAAPDLTFTATLESWTSVLGEKTCVVRRYPSPPDSGDPGQDREPRTRRDFGAIFFGDHTALLFSEAFSPSEKNAFTHAIKERAVVVSATPLNTNPALRLYPADGDADAGVQIRRWLARIEPKPLGDPQVHCHRWPDRLPTASLSPADRRDAADRLNRLMVSLRHGWTMAGGAGEDFDTVRLNLLSVHPLHAGRKASLYASIDWMSVHDPSDPEAGDASGEASGEDRQSSLGRYLRLACLSFNETLADFLAQPRWIRSSHFMDGAIRPFTIATSSMRAAQAMQMSAHEMASAIAAARPLAPIASEALAQSRDNRAADPGAQPRSR